MPPPDLFAIEIYRAGFIPQRYLFSNNIRTSVDLLEGSNIYILARTPKVRLTTSLKYENATASISATLLVGENTKIETSIPIGRLALFRDYPPDVLCRLPLEVEAPDRSKTLLTLSMMGTQRHSFSVSLVEYLAAGDFDLGFKPEVIYIGQTTDLLSRWQSHKKINKATALLFDDEELRVYFLHFRFVATARPTQVERVTALVDNSNRASRQFRNRISVIEQSLIKFYLPVLNEVHKSDSADTEALRWLASEVGTSRVLFDVGMHQHAYQFSSPEQVLPDELFIMTIKDDRVSFHATTPPSDA